MGLDAPCMALVHFLLETVPCRPHRIIQDDAALEPGQQYSADINLLLERTCSARVSRAAPCARVEAMQWPMTRCKWSITHGDHRGDYVPCLIGIQASEASSLAQEETAQRRHPNESPPLSGRQLSPRCPGCSSVADLFAGLNRILPRPLVPAIELARTVRGGSCWI